MVTVDYDHEIPYGHDPNGRPYPRLTLTLSNPRDPQQAVDVDAYLDSGAERSLFQGSFAPILGIDLLAGEEIPFQSATGHALLARLHLVRVSHPSLGSFDVELGFSTGPLGRNLLGRDFFSFTQIGFRERRLTLYITALP